MVVANHPDAGYFTEYIYTNDIGKSSNQLDVFLMDDPNQGCRHKTPEGFHCENCYNTVLYQLLRRSHTYIKMKKFLTYQLGLYNDPQKWVRELKRKMEYDPSFKLGFNMERMIDEVLDEIISSELPQADLNQFLSITNNFDGAVINQLNMGGGIQNISYRDVFNEMIQDGIPASILDEGAELLKDADKSDNLKKIAGNWIKRLPFKIMEKAGEWAIKNPDKLAKYQESLMQWIHNL